MKTQLTVKRTLREALVKLDECRAKLEEVQTDIQDLDIDDPDQSEVYDQLWIDIDDALGEIYELEQPLAQYITAGA